MARSTASTVDEYLAGLPEERRAVISAVREVVLRHLPAGYQETMNWGMISYEVPLERCPHTYNGQPLSFAGLAAQKSHYALYLMCAYEGSEYGRILRDAYAAMGKRPDIGKSCIRFESLDDLPLDAIGGIIASLPPDAYLRWVEAARQRR
jgi:hypothetical protein